MLSQVTLSTVICVRLSAAATRNSSLTPQPLTHTGVVTAAWAVMGMAMRPANARAEVAVVARTRLPVLWDKVSLFSYVSHPRPRQGRSAGRPGMTLTSMAPFANNGKFRNPILAEISNPDMVNRLGRSYN